MKLKITNSSQELAFIKYKGVKDGGKTYVDLQGSVAPNKTFESPIDVLPGSEISVRLESCQVPIRLPREEMHLKATNLSHTLFIQEKVSVEHNLVFR